MNKKLSYYAIASTYIGTSFGAGFISGQELLQFFLCDLNAGLKGVFIMMLGVFILSYVVMKSSFLIKPKSFEQLIVGKNIILSKAITLSFFVFSFGILIIMFAGAGALLNSLTGLPNFWGSLMMALLVLVIGITGTQGIINAFKLLVPVMFVVAIFTSLVGLNIKIDDLPRINQLSCPGNSSFLASILYISYNYYLMIAVLTFLGKDAKSLKDITLGSLLTSVVLGLSAGVIVISLNANYNLINNVQLPMLTIAQNSNYLLGNVYACILFGGLMSASIGMLFAILNILHNSKRKFINNHKITVPVMCLCALLGSSFGFSSLIAFIYPILGYIGLLAIVGVVFQYCKNSKKNT